jgi:uncharacterized HAD superfamily protein
MNKLTIALDCDDVIVPTAPLIIDWYNKTYGAKLTLGQFYSHDLTAWAAPDEETAIRRVDAFLMSEEYQNAAPFTEAIKAIQKLAAHHELHMVTGRPDFLTEATTRMLAKYFPDVFKTVEFTNFFGQKPRSKAEVCQQLNIDLLIDDHLHHAQVVAECGIKALLFGEYPWNETDTLPKGIQRVKGWQEVLALLLPDKHAPPANKGIDNFD